MLRCLRRLFARACALAGSHVLFFGTCLLGVPTLAAAQVPFPPPALLEATSVQQATAVIGAAQAERSGHLLIDAPEVVLPGQYRAVIKSEIPGTSHLILLRASIRSASSTAVSAPEKVLVFGKRLDPGDPATVTLDIPIADRQILTFLVAARGRWFWTNREVKVGKPVGLP